MRVSCISCNCCTSENSLSLSCWSSTLRTDGLRADFRKKATPSPLAYSETGRGMNWLCHFAPMSCSRGDRKPVIHANHSICR